MTDVLDLEKVAREETRWRILRILDAGRPLPVSEVIIARALGDAKLPVTPSSVRRELDYLESRKLVEIHGRGTDPTWSAELTHLGVDVVEYTVPCNPGIARPPKY